MREHDIDLTSPPRERWSFLRDYQTEMEALMTEGLRDLGLLDNPETLGLVQEYSTALLAPEIQEETAVIAGLTGRAPTEVLLLNLYYDAVKVVIGCSAFAADTPQGPIHARNLDWFSEGRILSKYTTVFHYKGAANDFTVIAWPGFAGALSGMAPGKFSITLNAVLSTESPALAPPITFLIRKVLAEAPDYATAVSLLSESDIFADCLLLVTGTRPGEMAVVERTPTKSAIRGPENGFIAVTNNYEKLRVDGTVSDNSLQATSCDRIDRLRSLLPSVRPGNATACLEVLSDPGVRMAGTLQQMFFQPATGVWTVLADET